MTATIQAMADYLTSGYWDFSETGARRGERRFEDSSLTIHWGGLQTKDRALVTEALDYWGNIAGLSFSITSTKSDADLVFKNGQVRDEAWSWSKLDTKSDPDINYITRSVVNVSKDWSAIRGSTDEPDEFLGTYRYGTFVHEIGHALGLGHQGKYNGNVRPSQVLFDEDTLQYSAMSYNDHPNLTVGRNSDVLTMPGLVDIRAIQDIYGTGGTSNPGNTVYGVGATASQAAYGAKWLKSTMVTIYDTGGSNDLLNFQNTNARQFISLVPGEFSNVYGAQGNVVIALGVTIENASGGNGNDRLKGNGADNDLMGRGGKDKLIGRAGDDQLQGHSGKDNLIGGAGRDQLDGGRGNDTLRGGGGADTFQFETGFGNDRVLGFETGKDVLDFSGATPNASLSQISGSDFTMTFATGESVRFEDLDILVATPTLTVAQLIDALL